jgi:hypothetical protein
LFKENWLKNISYDKGRGEGERKERKKYLIFNILLNNISHVLAIVSIIKRKRAKYSQLNNIFEQLNEG